MASSSPDTHTRALPTAWTAQESSDNIAEALDALENYKKKDASKGRLLFTISEISDPERDLRQSSYGLKPSAMHR